MTSIEQHNEEKMKILKGLEKVYERLIEFKRIKNSEIVVIKEGKITYIKVK